MGIRGKMVTGFLILATMLLIAGVWSVYELTTIGSSVQVLLDENYRSIDAARQMIEAIERQDSGLLLLLSGNWTTGRSIMAAADSSFQSAFAFASENLTISGEKEYIDEIATAYGSYRDVWVRPIVDTEREGNLDWYFEHGHRAFLEVRKTIENLMMLNDREMYQTASGLEQRAHRAVTPGIVAIIAALVFSLLFNYFVDTFVVQPIIAITEGLRRYVEKHEPFEVQIRTGDELSDLATTVRSVLSRLRPAKDQ